MFPLFTYFFLFSLFYIYYLKISHMDTIYLDHIYLHSPPTTLPKPLRLALFDFVFTFHIFTLFLSLNSISATIMHMSNQRPDPNENETLPILETISYMISSFYMYVLVYLLIYICCIHSCIPGMQDSHWLQGIIFQLWYWN